MSLNSQAQQGPRKIGDELDAIEDGVRNWYANGLLPQIQLILGTDKSDVNELVALARSGMQYKILLELQTRMARERRASRRAEQGDI